MRFYERLNYENKKVKTNNNYHFVTITLCGFIGDRMRERQKGLVMIYILVLLNYKNR
jgi:hypothetical protein